MNLIVSDFNIHWNKSHDSDILRLSEILKNLMTVFKSQLTLVEIFWIWCSVAEISVVKCIIVSELIADHAIMI